jgi:hypothetical protein
MTSNNKNVLGVAYPVKGRAHIRAATKKTTDAMPCMRNLTMVTMYRRDCFDGAATEQNRCTNLLMYFIYLLIPM